MTKFSLVSVMSVLVVGCAGAQESPPGSPAAPRHEPLTSSPTETKLAESAPEETLAMKEEVAPEKLAAMPSSQCADGEDCLPPGEFSQAVCQGRYPGLAIALFEKSTPWQRRYVKVESIDPVNTHGGSISSERLHFTEEVLLLRKQSSDAGGIQVSGASDVDVLRWDGTCVTVREEFLSVHRMPTIKNATINWKYLDDAIQEGLLEAKYVNIRYEQQRSACRGSSVSRPNPTCKKATDKLNDAITVAVRGGLALPAPEKLPKWKVAEENRSAALDR